MKLDSSFQVVVGIDFSDTGDLALSGAIELLARKEATSIHAVHVVTRDSLVAETAATLLERKEAALRDLPKQIWARIHEVAGSSRRAASLPIRAHVRIGEPADTILQVAVDYDADLIVVGTHGRRGLKKLILGSVAESLVKTAHCPVLVVRPKDYSTAHKSDRVDPPRTDPGLPGTPRNTEGYGPSELDSWIKHVPTGFRIV
jgi:nucleotide-binding universal stress UspA family protein